MSMVSLQGHHNDKSARVSWIFDINVAPSTEGSLASPTKRVAKSIVSATMVVKEMVIPGTEAATLYFRLNRNRHQRKD